MSNFKISISIPPDNPPITQVDQFGNEYAPINTNPNDKLIQILNQIKQQQYQQQKEETQQNQQQQPQQPQQQQQIQTPNNVISSTQAKLMRFQDNMNLARVEMEQLLFLIDMIRGNDKYVQLCNVDKPFPPESNQISDMSLEVGQKQKSLYKISEQLKLGSQRMKATVNTMSSWWNDVSTLRSKWRLKGKDTDRNQQQQPQMAVAKPNQFSSKQKLSIDYGYYTSGSFQDQTEADITRNPIISNSSTPVNGNDCEINIDFPNLPSQNSLHKRLYIDVKSSDSKVFHNHSSSFMKKKYKAQLQQNNDNSKQQAEQDQEDIYMNEYQQQEENKPKTIATETSIQKCTKLLNKAQKYQFNFEMFEQLYKEATNSNTTPAVGSVNSPMLQVPGQSNISTTTISLNNATTNTLSASTIGGENIMITENEIRIECGGLNLFIGMEQKSVKESQQSLNAQMSEIEENEEENQDRNRLLSVLKVVLKKISILQLKRSQKQLTLNLSRRNPKIVFGKKTVIPSDQTIISLTQILKHMDTYLRVTKVFKILENLLPIEIKSTPASTVSSSLFIINVIDSAQNSRQSMVPIEVSILQSTIDVVQGNSKSISNKSETLMGIFIVNQIQYYLMNHNQSYLNQIISTNNSLAQDLSDMTQSMDNSNLTDPDEISSSKKKLKLSTSQPLNNRSHYTNNQQNKRHLNYFQSITNKIFNL
ncbi:putative mediator complex subunit 17 [Tieghemostelium lacteum]|uniref:Putative mediator complex subunit 17 n=1 Tax=Tieghemostelium lacteum TaxID=361077 RepID=A0A151ZDP7_TIELA|nr:putative mediator complex subunit 17 [Tieghemostelium lacteum]|eukprot:KYQ92030.1 putative mediator complex subunit 17 [Tieghemostelium lacteum]